VLQLEQQDNMKYCSWNNMTITENIADGATGQLLKEWQMKQQDNY
jgi:hypothetical protein